MIENRKPNVMQPGNTNMQKNPNRPNSGFGTQARNNTNQTETEKKVDNKYKKIQIPLSKKLTDPADLYLENGIAYQFAEDFISFPNYQIRKILDSVKIALRYAENGDFNRAKNQMYMNLPMTAYNSGRKNELKPLHDFVKRYINPQSIQSIEDIKAFDQLYTSIVAYHTFLNRNDNGGKKNA